MNGAVSETPARDRVAESLNSEEKAKQNKTNPANLESNTQESYFSEIKEKHTKECLKWLAETD